MNRIKPEEIGADPFSLFSYPAVAVVEAEGKRNAITLSWGALGNLWGKKCVFLFIRDSRYSHGLFEKADGFSVCFLDEGHKELWKYFGKASGRDEDKIAQSGLLGLSANGVPCFAESKLVIIAKKLIEVNLPSEKILDKEIVARYYPEGGYHTVYAGEIVEVLKA